MVQLNELMGDASGKVTVGGELSHNKNFNKAQAFVSFSVTCDNNLETMQQVHALIQPVVHQLILADLKDMTASRDAYAAGNSAPGKTSAPPAKAPATKGPKLVAGPVAGRVGVQKPNFRR